MRRGIVRGVTDEELDVVDDNGAPLGTKPRRLIHRDGDWHRTFHCWVAGEHERRRFLLFQLRGPEKDLFPSRLDITAAGHLSAGERPQDGLRELREELGVDVAFDDLHYLGCRTDAVAAGEVVNREFAETYLLRDDRPLAGYRLQASELAGLVQIELSDAMRLFAGDAESVPAREAIPAVDGLRERERRVLVADVVPRRERYYLAVCIMAERMLDGERRLGI